MIADLATRHGLLGDLFRWPDQEHDLAALRLSEEQVQQFHQQGFLGGVDALSEDQVAALLDELQDLLDPKYAGHPLWYEHHLNESTDPDQVLFHALGAWRLKPGFHDLLWNPAIVVPAAQLLDGAVRFWHDQLFCKPPHQGGVVAWHQDFSYWTRTRPMSHLTCWIALDAASRENGCVQYVPQSHRWDLLPITGLAGDMNAIRQVVTDEQWQAFHSPVAVELRPGQCVFHHPLTVHGSQENRSARPRRAVVVNFFRDGVCSASDEPLLGGVPPIPSGEKMQGCFFPLLYDPQQAR